MAEPLPEPLHLVDLVSGPSSSCSSSRSRRLVGGAGVELSRSIAAELPPELVPELLHLVELLARGHQAAEPLRPIVAELPHLVDRCARPSCCRPSS